MTGRLRALLPILVVATVLAGGWLFANEPWASGSPAPATDRPPEDARRTPARETAPASSASTTWTGTDAHYGLERDEDRGGHTIERHVAKSEQDLRDRLDAEPDISAASSYFDLAIAEAVIALALAENANRVEEWERDGGGQNLAVRYTHSEAVGITLGRGDDDAHEVDSVVVVLRWAGDGWYVLTSYPDD